MKHLNMHRMLGLCMAVCLSVLPMTALAADEVVNDNMTVAEEMSIFAAESVTLKNVSRGILLNWDKIDGAARYNVYRQTGDAAPKKLATVKGLTYTDKTAKAGRVYRYYVKAATAKGKDLSADMHVGAVLTRIVAPTIQTAAVKGNQIRLTWKAVAGAESYCVMRRGGANAVFEVLDNTSDTEYFDPSVESGVPYTYTVCAIVNGDLGTYNTVGKTVTYWDAPENVTAENSAGGVLVSWDAADGAKYHNVYRQAIGSTKWTKLGTAKKAASTFLDKKAKNGAEYIYAVAVANSKSKDLSARGISLSVTYHAVPSLVKASMTFEGVRFTWKPVKNASEYIVYRRICTEDFEPIGTAVAEEGVKTCSYLDASPVNGVKNIYTVAAVFPDGSASSHNNTGKSVTFYYAPHLTQADYDGTSVTISWEAVEGAAKYNVYRHSVTSAKWAKVGTTADTVWTDKKGSDHFVYTVAAANKKGVNISAFDPDGRAACDIRSTEDPEEPEISDPTPTPAPTPTTDPTQEPEPTVTPTSEPEQTAEPTLEPGATPVPTPTLTPAPTDELDPTANPTPGPTQDPVATDDPVPHVHTWEEVTEIVHHDAVTEEEWVVDQPGTTETVPVMHYRCVRCGYQTTDIEEIRAHLWASVEGATEEDVFNGNVCGNFSAHQATETIITPEIGHYETKVVSEAWDEEVITGYKCSCGATREWIFSWLTVEDAQP